MVENFLIYCVKDLKISVIFHLFISFLLYYKFDHLSSENEKENKVFLFSTELSFILSFKKRINHFFHLFFEPVHESFLTDDVNQTL